MSELGNETKEALKAQGLVEGDKALSAEDEAANSFHTLLPAFKRQFRNLGGGAKDRVAEALIEFPLNERKLKFMNKNEEMVFNLAKHLLDCNMIIVNAVLNKRIEEQKTTETEGEVNERKET